ncbi:MAG: RpiB/LacA/LacB family sugar-phosphate isomerase [Planctomycetia bacterium]|nr:RpiB/LacA/LacB family sugar-phosphate isomerase [Planctomycetia bacterium]
MKIVVAADPFAVDLKKAIVEHLTKKGHELIDVGSSADKAIPYYEGAQAAAKILQKGEAARGILLCGTGMGMSVVANRFDGVRAAVVESVFAARMCRAINEANVLCLGAMIWGNWMACEAVDVFLQTELADGLEDLREFLQEAAKTVEAIKGN